MKHQVIELNKSSVPNDISIVKNLRDFMIEKSLPLWASQGWDPQNGGFVEKLNYDGSADRAATRRLRVQARQIYSFAKAKSVGWFADGGEVALKGLDYMLAKGRSPDGKPGFVHLLAADGSVVNPTRDTYDHAFVLLALAEVFKITNDARIREEIDGVIAFLDGELASPHGGFLEGVPSLPPRRQNPHMHMFEAMQSLYMATGDKAFLARASECFGLFSTCLFNPDTKTLGEFFSEDWTLIESATGNVEPGHQAEWVWLLMGYERLSGRPTANYRTQLLGSALRYSDAETGCLVDEGNQIGQMTKLTRRCWPQTECAKAWIAQAESGEVGAEINARKALVRVWKHYLDHPVPGGWYDQFDEDGNSLVEAIPASTMYHVICMIAEADRVLSGEI